MAVKKPKPAAAAQPSDSPVRGFLVAVLDMSWQLALVVLVLIVGGFYIDKALGSLPLFTIIGFGLAMVGTVMVVWRALRRLQT